MNLRLFLPLVKYSTCHTWSFLPLTLTAIASTCWAQWVDYKQGWEGPFIWQMVFAWKILLQHSKHLNLLPVYSTPTPFSWWLNRKIHYLFSCFSEEKYISDEVATYGTKLLTGCTGLFQVWHSHSTETVNYYRSGNIIVLSKWNEHSGSAFLLRYSRMLHTHI